MLEIKVTKDTVVRVERGGWFRRRWRVTVTSAGRTQWLGTLKSKQLASATAHWFADTVIGVVGRRP